MEKIIGREKELSKLIDMIIDRAGGMQATVVTTYALKDNMYSEISPVAITMNELFMVQGY